MQLQEAGDTAEETKERQSPEPSMKPVAGTYLRCLEDPMFELERKKPESGRLPTTTTASMTTSMTTTTATAATTTASSSAPQPSYRVLEAESSQTTGGGTAGAGDTAATTTTGSTAGGYHVLEASPVVPGSAQRSAASDVLEKARNRFDKFWGKGNNDTEN